MNIKSLKIVNAIHLNLKQFFIFDKTIKSFQLCRGKNCKRKNCSICLFLNTSYTIRISQAFFLPIMSNSDCNSIGCIYIIHCKLCNLFYVGQTGRSCHERIREHLNDIRNNDKDSEVAQHFNSKYHDYTVHFEFFIFKSDISTRIDRHYIENDLIQIVINITGKIINSFIPRIYLMKKTITFT